MDEVLKARIAELMAEYKTQEAVADFLGITHGMVSMLISGRREPSAALAQRMGLYKQTIYSRIPMSKRAP